MNALILAAGLGTRLRPLTDTMPKALVPVQGKPLLDHTIERLRDAGFTHIIVNVHHLAQQIIDHIAQSDYGLPIHISDERAQLLDTGGAVKHAAPLFPDDSLPILVHNVDILHDVDLRAFYISHSPRSYATLLTTPRTTTRYLAADTTDRLRAWTNVKSGEVKPAGTSLEGLRLQAFAGLHIVSRQAINDMCSWPDRFSIIDFYIRQCSEHPIALQSHPHANILDVGKPDTLAGIVPPCLVNPCATTHAPGS